MFKYSRVHAYTYLHIYAKYTHAGRFEANNVWKCDKFVKPALNAIPPKPVKATELQKAGMCVWVCE
jgi:hypothetical protein